MEVVDICTGVEEYGKRDEERRHEREVVDANVAASRRGERSDHREQREEHESPETFADNQTDALEHVVE
jgi:hypothetical protein